MDSLFALRGLGAAARRPGAGAAVLLSGSALHGVLWQHQLISTHPGKNFTAAEVLTDMSIE